MINCQNSLLCKRGEGSDGARGGRGQGMGVGEGGGAQPCKKHQLIIVMNKYCSAVHEVRPDLEETGQPREDQIRFTLS